MMIKTIGLFANQEEAQEAINALNNADLGDSKINTVSEWTEDLGSQLKILPVSNPSSGLSGVVGPRGPEEVLLQNPTSDIEAADFFKRSLQRGGLLVVASVPNEHFQNRAESILEKQRAVAVTTTA